MCFTNDRQGAHVDSSALELFDRFFCCDITSVQLTASAAFGSDGSDISPLLWCLRPHFEFSNDCWYTVAGAAPNSWYEQDDLA
jgi:hypothetical protein